MKFNIFPPLLTIFDNLGRSNFLGLFVYKKVIEKVTHLRRSSYVLVIHSNAQSIPSVVSAAREKAFQGKLLESASTIKM